MLTHGQESKAPGRVVVLGANGFIARHLQEWCRRHNVSCRPVGSTEIDLSDPANAPRLADLLRADDAIVMTSSLTPDKGRDYRALMANMRMVETICLALAKAPCAHFVYLSSDAVYDANKIPLDEDSTREPVDLYALSHVGREVMLSTELQRSRIPLCILRLTNIYGPGDTHNAYGPNRFVRSALTEGRVDLFGQGEERRSHVFIDDTVRLIGLCLERRSAGTLNVAVRHAVSFREVAAIVVRLAGRPVRMQYLPRTVPVIHKPYKWTQVFRFLYNLGRPIGPVVHRTFVNSAVFAAFPDFRFTTLEDGLVASIDAYRADLAQGRP
jgi:UDP-glucose 4-epimerase